MTLHLRPHHTSPASPISAIEAQLWRGTEDGGLMVSFVLHGFIDRLALAWDAPAVRTDGLWRTTCLETFLRAGDGTSYLEFNFAVSGAWVAYQFARHRSGRSDLAVPADLGIVAAPMEHHLTLNAMIPGEALAALPKSAVWQAGLSAIIEDDAGRHSYWALAHPPGEPDFHHADCFAHALPPI
jgi:hypothetical protein